MLGLLAYDEVALCGGTHTGTGQVATSVRARSLIWGQVSSTPIWLWALDRTRIGVDGACSLVVVQFKSAPPPGAAKLADPSCPRIRWHSPVEWAPAIEARRIRLSSMGLGVVALVMPRNERQEAVSRAFVHAVAGQAGYPSQDRAPDYGIDIAVVGLDRINGRVQEAGVELGIQVKSTTNLDFAGGFLRYDLDVGNYNALIRRRTIPAILVVYCLPDDDGRWLRVSENDSVLEHCGYWISLRGLPHSGNDTRQRVFLPVAQLFDATALRQLMRLVVAMVDL